MQPGRDGKIGRYLRRNDKQWTPACVITFDTEAYRIERKDGEDQQLRLWCARLDDRRQPRRGPIENLRECGHTGEQLATVVNEWVKRRENTWLYCHNLGYDLVTSQLVEYMAALGWVVDHCSTTPEYIFLSLAKGRHRITCTDMHHLIPKRLADIGELLGVYKGSLPPQEAPDEVVFEYCSRDVDVLATGVLTLMDYWDTAGLGNWAISGAACGWRAMRHTLPAKSVTLIEDPEGSTNDRAAIYGGRRYCWRHGELPPGRYSELDFTAAHATVMATYPMPVKRGGWFPTLDPHHKAIDGHLAVVIAECEVETDVPRWPCRIGDRIWYPVGRFRTVLASPDIAWARDLGCLRSIGRGQFHYTSGVYRPFFQRVLRLGQPGNDEVPALVAAMWKQWGRSVVGKSAQRGYAVEQTRMLTDKTWFYERATDWETGLEYWLVHYGGRIHTAKESGDGSQAYPAILALVESYERVAIGKAAEMLGPNVIIQCDTDGVWADVGALDNAVPTGLGFDLADIDPRIRIDLAIDCINNQLTGLQLREKHSVQRLAVWGPQNYDAGKHSKHSGRPSGVKEVQPGVWAGDTFPKIAYQMTHSEPGVFKVEAVSWRRPSNVIPGWVLANGAVRPVETTPGPDGQPQLTAYSETRHAQHGERLAPVQHAALADLWDQAASYVDHTPQLRSIWDRTPDEAIASHQAAQGRSNPADPPLALFTPGDQTSATSGR